MAFSNGWHDILAAVSWHWHWYKVHLLQWLYLIKFFWHYVVGIYLLYLLRMFLVPFGKQLSLTKYIYDIRGCYFFFLQYACSPHLPSVFLADSWLQVDFSLISLPHLLSSTSKDTALFVMSEMGKIFHTLIKMPGGGGNGP